NCSLRILHCYETSTICISTPSLHDALPIFVTDWSQKQIPRRRGDNQCDRCLSTYGCSRIDSKHTMLLKPLKSSGKPPRKATHGTYITKTDGVHIDEVVHVEKTGPSTSKTNDFASRFGC